MEGLIFGILWYLSVTAPNVTWFILPFSSLHNLADRVVLDHKTDDITYGRRDMDPNGWFWEAQGRMGYTYQNSFQL